MEVPSPRCLREELVWLQQNLSLLGSPVVLCHNDLLCKNIIYNAKGGEYELQKCSPWHYRVTELCCSVICIGPRTQVGMHCLDFLNPSHMLHPLCLHWAAGVELERSDKTIQLFGFYIKALNWILIQQWYRFDQGVLKHTHRCWCSWTSEAFIWISFVPVIRLICRSNSVLRTNNVNVIS